MNNEKPTADERAGMTWWNGLTVVARLELLERLHPASPAECWAHHKATVEAPPLRPVLEPAVDPSAHVDANGDGLQATGPQLPPADAALADAIDDQRQIRSQIHPADCQSCSEGPWSDLPDAEYLCRWHAKNWHMVDGEAVRREPDGWHGGYEPTAVDAGTPMCECGHKRNRHLHSPLGERHTGPCLECDESVCSGYRQVSLIDTQDFTGTTPLAGGTATPLDVDPRNPANSILSPVHYRPDRDVLNGLCGASVLTISNPDGTPRDDVINRCSIDVALVDCPACLEALRSAAGAPVPCHFAVRMEFMMISACGIAPRSDVHTTERHRVTCPTCRELLARHHAQPSPVHYSEGTRRHASPGTHAADVEWCGAGLGSPTNVTTIRRAVSCVRCQAALNTRDRWRREEEQTEGVAAGQATRSPAPVPSVRDVVRADRRRREAEALAENIKAAPRSTTARARLRNYGTVQADGDPEVTDLGDRLEDVISRLDRARKPKGGSFADREKRLLLLIDELVTIWRSEEAQ